AVIRLVSALGVAAVSAGAAGLIAQTESGGPRLEIVFTAGAHAEPVTGRVYVAISKTSDRTPIQQADSTGSPLFGANIEGLAAGQVAVIDARTLGHPIA